jgi:beta-glucanase (GH16 family)
MFTLAVVSLSILLSTIGVSAQNCDANNKCPESAPCCSEYGYCGSEAAHCLAGCNPLFSNTPGSCKPSPICKSQQYSFTGMDRFVNATEYDGNADTHDWTIDGGNIDVADGNLVMILTEQNHGVRVSSTRFVHYGTITATLKTGHWDGVVVGFITMSNVRDEIDWEFPGNRVTEGQTNFFYQGAESHGDTTQGLTDTYANWHDYTIDWSPDAMVFKVDGKTVRTLKASDYNKNGVSHYPTTPSRIQLSLWPAGTSASAPGTIQWAGGMIDWNDKDYVANGNSFRTYFKSISVTCSDQPTANQISYTYGDDSTSSKQTINLSSDSPVFGGSTGTNSTGTGPSNTTTTGTATTSISTTDTTSTTTTTPVTTTPASSGNSGNSKGGSKGGSNGHKWGQHNPHSHVLAGETTEAPPAPTGRNATSNGNDAFFGGADGSNSSQSTTSSQTQTPTNSGSSPSNTSGAHSQHVSMVPVLSVALVMALALVL